MVSSFLAGLKKAVQDIRKFTIEASQGCKWNFDQAMLASPLHELDGLYLLVDVHHDEGSLLTEDSNDLTQLRLFSGDMI